MPIPSNMPSTSLTKEPADTTQSSKRVLIVDDDLDMALAIQRVIRFQKMQSDIALDGFEAGHKLSEFKPDIITLDLHMPGMDGYRVIEAVRNMHSSQEVHIIVVSGLPERQIHRALTKGANQLLCKPFDNETLIAALNKAIEQQDSQQKNPEQENSQ